MFNLNSGETVVFKNDPFVVFWNGSATFRVFIQDGPELNELDVFTSFEALDAEQAMVIADLHIQSTYCE